MGDIKQNYDKLLPILVTKDIVSYNQVQNNYNS